MNNIFVSAVRLLAALCALFVSFGNAAPQSLYASRTLPLYDTDYIKANFIQDRIPPKDSCIFYVGINRKDQAIQLAASDCKGWTLYQSFETQETIFDSTVDPFKSYIAQGQMRDWFAVTSRAYAQVCTGIVRLVCPISETINPKSIWLTDELDAILKKETGVTRIDQYDPDTGLTSPYPTQPPAAAAAAASPLSGKTGLITDISCYDVLKAIADQFPDIEGYLE